MLHDSEDSFNFHPKNSNLKTPIREKQTSQVESVIQNHLKFDGKISN